MGMFTKFKKNKLAPSIWCDVIGHDNEGNPWACDLEPGHTGKHRAEIYVGGEEKTRLVVISLK